MVALVTLALSVSLLASASGVAPALAFVDNIRSAVVSRKLQPDELATVQLFEENTPSVVYVTNLAARRPVMDIEASKSNHPVKKESRTVLTLAYQTLALLLCILCCVATLESVLCPVAN